MKKTTLRKSAGFTLLEVCIALGIAAVGIFALQQYMPTGLKVANNASDQTAATSMLASIAQDLRNTPAGATNSPGFGIPLPLDTTNASTLISTNLFLAADGVGVLTPSQARYAATVWLANAASATVTSLTTARIKVYWPPTGNTQGSVETTTSFNRQFQRGGVLVAAKAVAGNGTSPNSYKLGGPYNASGYNPYGYDGDGRDHDGRDCDGYDREGRDCDGRDHDGYDRDGRGHDGYDHDGNDRDGHHKGCDDGGSGKEKDNGCGHDK